MLKKGTSQKGKYGNNRIAVRVVETGEVFDTIKACANELGVSSASVYKCIYYCHTVKGLHIEKVNND